MNTFLLIVAVVLVVVLIMVGAVRPVSSPYSEFERRKRARQKEHELETLRDNTYRDVMTVQRFIEVLILGCITSLVVCMYGGILGTLLAVIIIMLYRPATRIGFVHNFVQARYKLYETHILQFVVSRRTIIRVWGRNSSRDVSRPQLYSEAELFDLLHRSESMIDPDVATQLRKNIAFSTLQVKDHMTPVSKIDVIDAGEILGPLVLDDLHKTGHSRFPVVKGDNSNMIVGLLYLQDVLTIDATKKHTAKVESAMKQPVISIKETSTLPDALNLLVSTHQDMLIVQSADDMTAGVLSMHDILSELTSHVSKN